jgi:hypothetical protein
MSEEQLYFIETVASNTVRDAQAEDKKTSDLQKPLNAVNKQLKLAKELGKKWWKNYMHNFRMQQKNQSTVFFDR